MVNTTKKVAVVRLTAGLLALGVVSWVWASIYSEHCANQALQEVWSNQLGPLVPQEVSSDPPSPVPSPERTEQAQPPNPDSLCSNFSGSLSAPERTEPALAVNLTKVGSKVRSWLSRHTSPPKDGSAR